MKPKYPNIKVKLVGQNGNAFAILVRVINAMRKANVEKSEIDTFQEEAMSGDYDHLLQTCLKYVECR